MKRAHRGDGPHDAQNDALSGMEFSDTGQINEHRIRFIIQKSSQISLPDKSASILLKSALKQSF